MIPRPPIARPLIALLTATAIAALTGACEPGSPSTPSTSAPATVASPVEGVVIDVDAAGLTDVSAFTLRTTSGDELRFVVGELENPVDFPPSHLATHLADAAPVRVSFRAEGEDLVAIRLEDAQAP